MLYGQITRDEAKMSIAERNVLFSSWSLLLNCFQSLSLHILYSMFLFGFCFQHQCSPLWFKIIKYLCSFNLLDVLLNLFQELVLRYLFLHLACQAKQWTFFFSFFLKKHIYRVLFHEHRLKKQNKTKQQQLKQQQQQQGKLCEIQMNATVVFHTFLYYMVI